jgi:hypothetical protein
MKRLRVSWQAVAIVCLGLSAARADLITISDFGDGVPTATVLRDGVPQPITVLPDSGPEFLHFQFTSQFPAANTDTVSRDLTEPAGGDGLPLSDRFLLSFLQGGFVNDVRFGSDPENGVPSVPQGHTVFPSIVENGLAQVVLQTFFTGSGALADQYAVQSDVAPGLVPGGLQSVVSNGGPIDIVPFLPPGFPNITGFFQSDADGGGFVGDQISVDFHDGFGPQTAGGGEYGQVVQNGYDFRFQRELALVQVSEGAENVSDYFAMWQSINGQLAFNYTSDGDVGAIVPFDVPPPPTQTAEPSTFLMLATGSLAVFAYRLRRRQRGLAPTAPARP